MAKTQNSSTKTSTSKTSGKATTMAELMRKHSSTFVSPKKGDVLEGTITKLSSSEILVDIGAKSQATVLEKDSRILKNLLLNLKVGDKVTVSVLNPESDFGNTVVSLRRFNEDKTWQKLEELLKSKEKIEVIIDNLTKGGFLVSTYTGLSGFLPNSQISSLGIQVAPGEKVEAIVLEVSRPLRKVIFSQKATVSSKEFENKASAFKRGENTVAEISSIAPFGIFAILPGNVEGFVHLSEISWDKLSSIPESFQVGDKFEAEILGLDKNAKRVNLSIKKLTKNPYEEKLKEFTPDKKVKGTVTSVSSNGVILDLGEGIEGVIKKEKMPPTLTFTEGQNIDATVLEIDKGGKVILSPVLKEKPIGYR